MREAHQHNFARNPSHSSNDGQAFVMAVESGGFEPSPAMAKRMTEIAARNAMVTTIRKNGGETEADILAEAFAGNDHVFLVWTDASAPYGFGCRIAKGMDNIRRGIEQALNEEVAYTVIPVMDENTADVLSAELGDAHMFRVPFDLDIPGDMHRAMKVAHKRARKLVREKRAKARRRQH
jgi:hypothetical protein